MNQFLALIQTTTFFANVGAAASGNGVLALSSLDPWGSEIDATEADKQVADQMIWLPTSRDQEDPFYPKGLDHMATDEHALMNAKNYRMEVYKTILTKLRNVDATLLNAGSLNFTEAAKGAAAYAFRNAATELALGISGKWLEVAEFYFRGHWPCGITEQGQLIVF